MSKEVDYTDGGGWAKFDFTAALELTNIIMSFPKAKQEHYTRMLLILYASINKGGYVTMGYRTLARLAGVTEDQARYFIAKLEEQGKLTKGAVKRIGNTSFTNRRFVWQAEENTSSPRVREKIPSPRGKIPMEIPSGCGKIPREIPSHQSNQNKEITLGVGALDAAPPQQIADSIYTDASMPWGTPATL